MKVLFPLMAGAAMAADHVVIVAGSNGYENYRHQADACHAYQIVIKNGVAPENIITMMYDDVANSRQNRFPGKLFNKPTAKGEEGVDVYAGCKIDYKGEDVSPENFISVITGDDSNTQGKPVLNSTKDDNVFINFVDHGGTGIIAFQDNTLSALKLNAALKQTHEKKLYKKLVFYMEACESGSMFEQQVTPPGMYVVTAANGKESSYGTYCPPYDKVQGKPMYTCLGDLFSVNWMEDADAATKGETLATQFETVKKLTNKSHVMQFGDKSFMSEEVSDFYGGSDITTAKTVLKEAHNSVEVASPDIPLHLAYYNYLRADKTDFAGRQKMAEKLQQQISRHVQVDNIFSSLSQEVSVSMNADKDELFHAHPEAPVVCDECCESMYKAFHTHCGGLDDYSLQYSRVVVNVCNHVNHEVAMTEKLVDTLQGLCKKAL